MTSTIPIPMLAANPVRWELWPELGAEPLAAACLEAIGNGIHPGVVGVTTPQAAQQVAAALGRPAEQQHQWTRQRIDTWRDQAIDTLEGILFAPARTYDVADALAVGFGLADSRVRDVILLDMFSATAAERAEAGRRLWPVADILPESLHAPIGTTLAILEATQGRAVHALLQWVTAADPDYQLARIVASSDLTPMATQAWIDGMAGLNRDQCRYGTQGPPAQVDDPLADVDPAPAQPSINGPIR